ncbi:hypothetical protein C3V39_05310 [Prevotella sp. oral taxon 820]|nr:hypothetical protein C3V39_05310 [Prevotella sp. oral taxon 820]
MEACQVPNSILSQLPTKKLVELCARHPLAGICYAYDNPINGAKYLMNNFNVFQELKKRPDAARCLLNFYNSIDFSRALSKPYPITLKGEEGKEYRGLNINFIELIIASEEIPDIYNNDNINLLKQITKRVYEQKIAQPIFGKIGLSTPILISSKINLKVERLDSLTKYHLQELIKSGGFSREINLTSIPSKYVTTRNGKKVLVHLTPELSNYEIQELHNICMISYPNVIILSEASSTYNCHDYAWLIKEGITQPYWLNAVVPNNENNLSQIWAGKIFQITSDSAHAKKIVYYSSNSFNNRAITHSAIKSKVAGYYESKWGAWPLIRHLPNDVPPEYGTYKRFITTFYDGLLNCSAGSGIIRKNTTVTFGVDTSYGYPDDVAYSEFIISNAKDDEDEVELGHAVITQTSKNYMVAYFTRRGLYNIYCNLYESDGRLCASYDYQALVEDY